MSYAELCEHLETLHHLEGANAILGWDMETQLPPKAADIRGEQLAALSAVIHEKATHPRIGELLSSIDEAALDEAGKVNLEETRRMYEQACRVPAKLVKELQTTCSKAHHAWVAAKAAKDPAGFLPVLERLVALKREEAQHRAPDAPVYDTLLDDYERGLTATQVEADFADLRAWLVPFVDEVLGAPKQPDVSMLRRPYDLAAQERFGKDTIKLMGFDFEAGRTDTSAHPFCGGQGPFDVRLTTRYIETEVLSSYFSFVHEAGHALYEQGLDPERASLPAGQAASMAIHESQSRLWENCIARSRPYWEFMFPRFKEAFGEQAAGVELEPFFFAVNAVERSLRRVESDEVTYNLHVILRFELERDLFAGALEVRDLPEAWDAKSEAMLGIRPPAADEGVLQDIHWAFAGFGYFPTYTYGNLYAAQIYATMRRELDVDGLLCKGEFAPLRDWLRERVHRRGKLDAPSELIKRVSGEVLDARHMIEYLEGKVRPLYGL